MQMSCNQSMSHFAGSLPYKLFPYNQKSTGIIRFQRIFDFSRIILIRIFLSFQYDLD